MNKKVFAKWVLLQVKAEINGETDAIDNLLKDDSYLMCMIDAMDQYGIDLIEVHECEGCED